MSSCTGSEITTDTRTLRCGKLIHKNVVIAKRSTSVCSPGVYDTHPDTHSLCCHRLTRTACGLAGSGLLTGIVVLILFKTEISIICMLACAEKRQAFVVEYRVGSIEIIFLLHHHQDVCCLKRYIKFAHNMPTD